MIMQQTTLQLVSRTFCSGRGGRSCNTLCTPLISVHATLISFQNLTPLHGKRLANREDNLTAFWREVVRFDIRILWNEHLDIPVALKPLMTNTSKWSLIYSPEWIKEKDSDLRGEETSFLFLVQFHVKVTKMVNLYKTWNFLRVGYLKYLHGQSAEWHCLNLSFQPC